MTNEGAGSALQASSVSSPAASLSQLLAVFRVPAVAIVSRDVGVAYAMQLDLAEPHSSLVIEQQSPAWLTTAVCRRVARIGRLELRGSDTHELR